jgi:hypothetical protein
MERESMEQLKLDRRLIRRRAWISPEELERELAKLPDVSHKIAPPDEDDASREAAGGERDPQ